MVDPRVQASVSCKGITRLCHFTQSRKLAHIFTGLGGIWSTSYLREHYPDLLDQMDTARLDGHEDYICCSIEYPNTWYLNRVLDHDPLFKEWVIIYISPSIIWRSDTLYSPRNAAAERGNLIVSDYAGFTQLYQQQVSGAQNRVRARTPHMLPACPTDDQAEVLVKQHIPYTDIIGVAVNSPEQARIEKNRLALLGCRLPIKWYIAPEIFNGSWSRSIRIGQRPQEIPFEE